MLLGTKTVLNELVAYIDLASAPGLSERTGGCSPTPSAAGFSELRSLPAS